ncbi:unnamed protein product [Nesidiocoris tenuis]|uniref:asparagine--tRNA ligase n=1 Tax=Nesidiocoris tenuis TaxID=355587 RepID=A0A6H5GXJ7_9HEMI|nr:unnamed protein product [Nesidiocoris tenuis]
MWNSRSLLRIAKSGRGLCFSIRDKSFRRIVNLKPNEKSVAVKGWVSSLRKMKDTLFVDVLDGSSCRPLQIVVLKAEAPDNLQCGCSIEASGDLVENQNAQTEMQNAELSVVGPCNLEDGYPFAPRKRYTSDYVRQFLHLRHRYSGYNSLLRIRNEATLAVHSYYKEKGYINVHTPILTSNDCEGAGETFVADKFRPTGKGREKGPTGFFDDDAYLTVSGQLHLEVAARGLSQVYTFGPTFRAENSKSRLHLSEFYMLEAETTMLQTLDDLVESVQELIHYMTHCLISNCLSDLEKCRKELGDPNLADSLTNFDDMMSNFTTMSYREAADILLNNADKLKTAFRDGQNFTKEQELFIVKHNNNVPVFVVEWPRSVKPFYMKSTAGDEKKVMAFDLLCPNVGEICGGSYREDDYARLASVLKQHRLQETLDWYLELRKFGNVTTCGYGLGFERYLQVLLQILNIKDVIPFPRWPHNCKL